MRTKTYTIVPGRRYDKIVSLEPGGFRNVYVFIDKITGIWYPAASWSAPNKRYYITDDERAMWQVRLAADLSPEGEVSA